MTIQRRNFTRFQGAEMDVLPSYTTLFATKKTSADDGYANKKVREQCLEDGVEVFSTSVFHHSPLEQQTFSCFVFYSVGCEGFSDSKQISLH
ncbi:MAG: hypothetical protein Q9M20_04335 [Mariprofundaceae bacterium]|nr:hypothetical protein [Mariprofundaceae bacterium]